jgi:hypothetical protein
MMSCATEPEEITLAARMFSHEAVSFRRSSFRISASATKVGIPPLDRNVNLIRNNFRVGCQHWRSVRFGVLAIWSESDVKGSVCHERSELFRFG